VDDMAIAVLAGNTLGGGGLPYPGSLVLLPLMAGGWAKSLIPPPAGGTALASQPAEGMPAGMPPALALLKAGYEEVGVCEG
jgi:hypothetical protein